MSPHPRSRPHSRLAALAAAALALVLVSGCSSAVDELSKASAEPQQGGTLRVGTTADVVPANTFTNSSDTGDLLVGAVYDTLIDYPLDSLEPEPRLATSWEFNPDGTELTLQLRDDVTFHSGRAFTSKDVEASIKTWADPLWTVQLQRTAAGVTGFDTSDEHAITLTFDHPMSNVLDLLDMMPIIDAESLDDVRSGKTWIGTGPFAFESWQPGSQLTLVANEDYWDGAPLLDGVDIKVIPDPQAQVAQLRSGQLDMTSSASKRDIESLSEDDRFSVQEWKGAEAQLYIGANVENKALRDVRVRQAVAYALDRDRIVEEVLRGSGRAITLPWPEYSPAYDADADATYSYDLQKAAALVEEVSAEGGEVPTLPLTYPSGSPDYDAVAQIVQSDLAEIGITVELQPVEQAEAIKRLIGGEFEGLWLLQHSYAQFNPSTLTVSAYPFNADKNTSGYLDPDYQKAAETAWEKKPDEVTEEDYAALNQQLLDGSFLLEIALIYSQSVTSSQVGGLELSKRNEFDLSDAYLAE
ncbi:ABC transporter substrate-binding protein [Nocardioides sambongensis]|uniref:ABC transporter substrate-binding protein n=1 Tax=Nocardioides sambongensis TaxID=2589074 RepID=UPI001129FA24|nr:ABC transporter substrate-binding protein [Nocardioides sambongensis]